MSEKNMSWFRKLNPLHYIYVIVILLMIIIFMFAYFYCGDNEIVKLIGFAGTLASIILSVIAIFMTILSNDSMGSLLNNVQSASESVKNLPASIDESVGKLNKASTIIETSVNDMRDKLQHLETKIMHVDDEISETKAKIDDLKERSAPKQEDKVPQDYINKQLIDSVIKSASYFGLMLMYSMCIAHSKKVTFKLSELSRISGASEEYMHGYAIALSTTKIAVVRIDESIVSIDSISSLLNKEEVLKRLEFVSLTLAKTSKVEETLTTELSEIDNMFSVSESSVSAE